MLETERLILRPWRDEDRAPFAALNADPVVMEHFPSPLTREQSDNLVDRFSAAFASTGFGCLPVQVKGGPDFIGFVGLSQVNPPNPLAPTVEIGWRLAQEAWGKGYAAEAARAWLDHGLNGLKLDEIVSFTAVDNLRSQAVMQRIGMVRYQARDFEHPNVAEGHRLRPHLVWALNRP
jgi:RimJ/RimL family protein N-acetyltransferase